jgi:N-acetylmuramoyl-L-alanine amidase
MRTFDRRLHMSIGIPLSIDLPSSLVATAATCAVALAVIPAHPAYAGWGTKLLRSVVPGLGHRPEEVVRRDSGQPHQSQAPQTSMTTRSSQTNWGTQTTQTVQTSQSTATNRTVQATRFSQSHQGALVSPAALTAQPQLLRNSSAYQPATYRSTQSVSYTMPPLAPPVASYRTDAPVTGVRHTSASGVQSSIKASTDPLPGLIKVSATPGNTVYFGTSSSETLLKRAPKAPVASEPPVVSALLVASAPVVSLAPLVIDPPSSRASIVPVASSKSRTSNLPDVVSKSRTSNPPDVVGKSAASLIAAAPPFDPLSYQWSPRRAIEYLTVDDDLVPFDKAHSAQKIVPQQLPEPVVVRPRPVVPTSAAPPSLVSRSFRQGVAGQYSWDDLVAAGVFENDPLRGSVYKRKGAVKYIILHSTETANPADARRVILSWNNRGLRHPDAQFVVDRDGTICSTTDPDQVVIHIEPSRALAGYSNDNSIGIEIVRSGKQEYTRPQLDSVNRLVAYLQSHYSVPDANVTTHHHVQPSDRSDPVNFDMLAFESEKASLQTAAIAYKANYPDHSSKLIRQAQIRAESQSRAESESQIRAESQARAHAQAQAFAQAQARRAQITNPNGDLDDALADDEEAQTASFKTGRESAQYLSTMPKTAPEFRRRNKDLVLRD